MLTKRGNKREFSESLSATRQKLGKRRRLGMHVTAGFSTDPAHRTSSPSSGSAVNDRTCASALLLPARPTSSSTACSVSTTPSFSITPNTTVGIGVLEQSPASCYSRALHGQTPSRVQQIDLSKTKSSLRSHDVAPATLKENAPREAAKQPLAILKAVSGRYMYPMPDCDYLPLRLRRSPNNPLFVEAWSDRKLDKEHAWISFSVKDVGGLRYGGCYLHFRRSMDRYRPPILTLQFASAEDASQVANMIEERIVENCEREKMEQFISVAWERALQRSGRVSHWEAVPARMHAATARNRRRDSTQTYPMSPESDSNKPEDEMTTQSDQTGERRLSPNRKETSGSSRRCPETKTSWEESWKQTLVYPAKGRNRASVDKEDVLRLEDGKFLNDNLISFYLLYLQINGEREHPEVLRRVHIFSTFFFAKLTSRKGGINYDGVRNWTAKLDLFSYDYIVVPVNEDAHWYLAIICNASKLLEPAEDHTLPSLASADSLGVSKPESSKMTSVERETRDIALDVVTTTRRSSRQFSCSTQQCSSSALAPANAASTAGSPAASVREPRAPSRHLHASPPSILTFDSLGSTHSATCKALKEYLVEEAKDKKNVDLVAVPGGMKVRGLPEQNNFCDCGIFVLGYMEEFLKDPEGSVRGILMKQNVDWSIDAGRLRRKVHTILLTLQREQDERLTQGREEECLAGRP